MNKTSNRAVTHTSYKNMKSYVFYYKSDMHVRPMRFSILCTPTDSSDETIVYSTILLCLFSSKYDIYASRLNYSTVSSNKLNILICKLSARKKQSVMSVAFKALPETRLGICIYKTSLLHRTDDYIGFTPNCSPTFYNKIAPMILLRPSLSIPVCFCCANKVRANS